jgi:hypothetical protein
LYGGGADTVSLQSFLQAVGPRLYIVPLTDSVCNNDILSYDDSSP